MYTDEHLATHIKGPIPCLMVVSHRRWRQRQTRSECIKGSMTDNDTKRPLEIRTTARNRQTTNNRSYQMPKRETRLRHQRKTQNDACLEVVVVMERVRGAKLVFSIINKNRTWDTGSYQFKKWSRYTNLGRFTEDALNWTMQHLKLSRSQGLKNSIIDLINSCLTYIHNLNK